MPFSGNPVSVQLALMTFPVQVPSTVVERSPGAILVREIQ
jgi:hypothetical protein